MSGSLDNLYAQPFALADEMLLPGGKRIRGTLARVCSLLVETERRQYRHRVGLATGPPGWVPAYLFRAAWCGGEAGDRRRRDLREQHGIEIDLERFERHGEETATTLYRLAPSAAERLREGDHATPAQPPQPAQQAPADASASATPAPATWPTPAAPAAALAHPLAGHNGTGGEGGGSATAAVDQVGEPASQSASASTESATSSTDGATPEGANLAPATRYQPRDRAWIQARPLQFYTHIGTPAGAIGICCDPANDGWRAPRSLTGKVVRGELTGDQANSAYLSRLRAAYKAGDLDPILDREDGPLVLWISPFGAWSPLPALIRALTACGATHLGVWSERGKVAA